MEKPKDYAEKIRDYTKRKWEYAALAALIISVMTFGGAAYYDHKANTELERTLGVAEQKHEMNLEKSRRLKKGIEELTEELEGIKMKYRRKWCGNLDDEAERAVVRKYGENICGNELL